MIKKIIGRNISILYRHKNMYTNLGFKKFNINKSQAETLLYVDGNPGLSLKEINNFFMLNKASITKIINHLEKLGYVERQINKKDRREYGIFSTLMGKSIIPRIINIFESWETLLLKDIPKDEVENLRVLLSCMVDNITDLKDK